MKKYVDVVKEVKVPQVDLSSRWSFVDFVVIGRKKVCREVGRVYSAKLL